MNGLKTQLPVHVGDILSGESIAAIQRAVKQFDESLEVHYTVIADLNQVELRIMGPGGK